VVLRLCAGLGDLAGLEILRAIAICGGLLAAAVSWLGPAVGQDLDDALRIYAVHIDRTPKQPWTGYGIYLGNGLVITAAHVIGWAFWNKPRVEIAGKDLAATVVKEGSLNGVDVTLVSVDQTELPVSLRLRRLRICQISPVPGEQVIVVTPEGTARSQVISRYRLPRNLSAKFGTVIGDVATTGDSGSGVFDANQQCLLGIISRRIWETRFKSEDGRLTTENHDIAKFFVPSLTIIEFLPSDVHF
jgi:hypothetical protein